MARTRQPAQDDIGPTLRAIPFLARPQSATWLLSTRQRKRLADIGTRIHVPARMILYRERTPATSIFFNASGVVKSFHELPSGRRWVAGFLYQHDVFGLARNGLYVRTTQSVTEATLYRVPLDTLAALLERDPELDMRLLCKITHELCEAQRHALLISRRDAAGKVATFVRQLEVRQSDDAGGAPSVIRMPMSRTDAANYLALSPEAVSRATRKLERQGILRFIDRHRVHILDRLAFDRLVSRL